MKITSYFVDHDGRTYRVALANTTPDGRPLIAVRRDHQNHDTGRGIDLDGRLGKLLVAAAREQRAKGGANGA